MKKLCENHDCETCPLYDCQYNPENSRPSSSPSPSACSASEEKRLRGNVRLFCDKQIPWTRQHGGDVDDMLYFVDKWNESLKAAGLEPEPTQPNDQVERPQKASKGETI